MTSNERDIYAEFMAALVPDAEQKLGRELTASEQQSLWNVKSLLRLEQLSDYLALRTATQSDAEAWISDIVQRYKNAE